MEQTVNTFTSGLNLDLAPLVTPKTVLTNCLNGTLITYNGNELVLQNDMGNGKIESAKLPTGYVPVGMKLHGGIIYVASYNPSTLKSLIGSFPSPERNVEDLLSNTGTDFSLPTTPGTYILKAISTSKLKSGDSLYLWFNGLTRTDFTPTFNNNGTLYNDLNRRYTISISVLGADGSLIDLTSNFLPQEYSIGTTKEYYWYGMNIATTPSDPNYTIYNGISGIPYIKILYNGILDLDLDVLLTKNISNSNTLNLQINADYLFNCPYKTNGFKGVKVIYLLSTSITTDGTINWGNAISTSIPFTNESATRTIDGYTINLKNTISNIVYGNSEYIKYEVYPYFNYDSESDLQIDKWKVSGQTKISDISSGISTINAWKYRYESANDIYITWGMNSYPSGENGQDIPKDIKFYFIPILDITESNLTLTNVTGTETYTESSNVIYYDKDGKIQTLTNEVNGQTIKTADVYRYAFNNISTISEVVVYEPDTRSNYNGIFTEDLVGLNFNENQCYLVMITYKVNNGTTDINNVYYSWLITTDLYNEAYYSDVLNFNTLTNKLVNVPEVTINANINYEEGSSLNTGTNLTISMTAPSELNGTNYVKSNYSYVLTPSYSISYDESYPINITFTNASLTFDNTLCSLTIQNDSNGGVTFNDNVLSYTYTAPYLYTYTNSPISVTNYFLTYNARKLTTFDHMYEIVISTESFNSGDYNKFDCYCTIYDMSGEVVVEKTKIHESLPNDHVCIDEDDASIKWKQIELDIDKLLNTLALQEMSLIAIIVMPLVLTKTVDLDSNTHAWYGVSCTRLHIVTDLAYNFIVSTEGDPIFLNENFIVTTGLSRQTEDNSFITEATLYNSILTTSKTYNNVSNSGSDTYTYNPITLSSSIKYNPYRANSGMLGNVAVCTGASIIYGYYPEITSDRTNDVIINEPNPIKTLITKDNLTMTINNVTTSNNTWLSKLSSIVPAFFNFTLTNTTLTSNVSGLPDSFEHTKFGSSKAALASTEKVLLSLIKYDDTTYIIPENELSSDQIFKITKNGDNWEYYTLNMDRHKVVSTYYSLFRESSTALSRVFNTATIYKGRKNNLDKTGVLFRYPAGIYVTNAPELIEAGNLQESKPN